MFRDVAAVTIGFLIPLMGFLFVARLWYRRLPSSLPAAAARLAEGRGWSFASLDGEERAALVAVGFLKPSDALTPAAIWKAPDATFSALVVGEEGRSHGVVIVTPHNLLRKKLASLATRHLVQTRETPLALAGDVAGFRVNGRIVLRRPNIETAEDLERLIMAACAILDE